MSNVNYSIDTYRDNQLNDHLNRMDEKENEVDNPCNFCGDEATILETYIPNGMIGVKEEIVCRECRARHIKANEGIKGYYKRFKIQTVELI
jgi:hypothetical protein